MFFAARNPFHPSNRAGFTDRIIVGGFTAGTARPHSADVEHKPLVYPEIPMDLLLENDRVIVQRVQVEPGEWEGIHSHPGNQVFIHIKGGTWAGRMAGVQSSTTSVRADGAVGWMEAIDINEEHESGNVGDTTIDLVWVTLK